MAEYLKCSLILLLMAFGYFNLCSQVVKMMLQGVEHSLGI